MRRPPTPSTSKATAGSKQHTIRSYFKPGPDGRLGPYQIDEAYKTLYGTGLFLEISIRNVGGRLIVTVVENPVINRIQFEGNIARQGRAAQDSKSSPRSAERCCGLWSRTTCSGSSNCTAAAAVTM